ncbi:MAG: hypothetical protein KY476_14350 [Planctomycetes bacterium]|nr:hypothetical protein [Planctomycetota bacterium]
MVIPVEWLIPLVIGGILAGIGLIVFLIFRYGANSRDLKEGWARLEAGQHSQALAKFRKVARSAVAASEFKIFPWEQPALERALEGLEAVYEETGVDCDLSRIRKCHSRFEKLQKAQRRGEDRSEELQQARRQGRKLVDELPKV